MRAAHLDPRDCTMLTLVVRLMLWSGRNAR